MECKSENVCRLHSIFCAENATINEITITTTQIYVTLLSGKLREGAVFRFARQVRKGERYVGK